MLLLAGRLPSGCATTWGAEDRAPPAALAAADEGRAGPALRIDCDFPGGNIVVQGIEDGTVQLRPDLRDTSTWWFYWYFRVCHAEGRELRFQFEGGQPVGVRGPAVSLDGGQHWRWLGSDGSDPGAFTYRFPDDANEVRFAFTIPYLRSDWDQFLQAYRADSRVRPGMLCRSRAGREVPSLRFGCLDQPPRAFTLVTCRHHACESMANFVLEGLIQEVLSGESGESKWLGSNIQFLVVPFVDIDGVQAGDQGKNRRPRDHGRDYAGESLYPETAAIRSSLAAWTADRPCVTLDLHCPWIRGPHNEDVYIVGSSQPRMWDQQQRFGAILERVRSGPLPYQTASNLPFGVAWNRASNYADGKSLGRWAAEQPAMRLAASFEIPYANAGGVQVSPATARALGRDMAVALGCYLREALAEGP
jgi:hypothetical protein